MLLELGSSNWYHIHPLHGLCAHTHRDCIVSDAVLILMYLNSKELMPVTKTSVEETVYWLDGEKLR